MKRFAPCRGLSAKALALGALPFANVPADWLNGNLEVAACGMGGTGSNPGVRSVTKLNASGIRGLQFRCCGLYRPRPPPPPRIVRRQ
jgi:hypothetical protein